MRPIDTGWGVCLMLFVWLEGPRDLGDQMFSVYSFISWQSVYNQSETGNQSVIRELNTLTCLHTHTHLPPAEMSAVKDW